MATSDIEKANLLNTFFYSVFTQSSFKILPLTMQLELYDVVYMFFIWSLKGPTDAFNIIIWSCHLSYWLYTFYSSQVETCYLSRTNSARHFYFNRMPSLWNSLPTIDLDLSTGSIKLRVQRFLWDHFIRSCKSDSPCTNHFNVPLL